MVRVEEKSGQKPSERLMEGSLDEAIELTERFLAVHGDEWDVECEVRPLAGPEFGIDG